MLAIVIAGLLGPTRRNAMIAIGIIITAPFARVVRAAVLEVMGFPFIESSRALGASDVRVIFRHVLPNIMAPIIVLTSVYFSQAILSEATLSYLGLGVQPPLPSWGMMVADGQSYLALSPWLCLLPSIALILLIAGLQILSQAFTEEGRRP